MDALWRQAEGLANLINGHPIAIGRSAEQIYQTMLARPGWNRQNWIRAVEKAARELIASGQTDLVGPALERRADWIYQEEL